MNYTEHYIHMYGLILVFIYTIIISLIIMSLENVNIIYRIIPLFIIIIILYLGFDIKLYLPFLGKTALPPSIFNTEMIPNGEVQKLKLELDVPDGTKVLYWGAKSAKDVKEDPIEAYGDYSNTGISTVENKETYIFFNCPSEYKVGMTKTKIDRHIHYRLIEPNNPMISAVYTKKVKC